MKCMICECENDVENMVPLDYILSYEELYAHDYCLMAEEDAQEYYASLEEEENKE